MPKKLGSLQFFLAALEPAENLQIPKRGEDLDVLKQNFRNGPFWSFLILFGCSEAMSSTGQKSAWILNYGARGCTGPGFIRSPAEHGHNSADSKPKGAICWGQSYLLTCPRTWRRKTWSELMKKTGRNCYCCRLSFSLVSPLVETQMGPTPRPC